MTVHSVDITGERVLPLRWTGDGNPLWVDVRPNLCRIHVLAGDILSALGKRRDVSGRGRNESEDVRLAAAWLSAHRVTDLVVVNAQRIDPRILLSLTKLATRAGTGLWLLHRPPLSDTVHRAITKRTHVSDDMDEVPVPATPAAAPHQEARPDPSVPHHDVHAFLAAVRRTLSPADVEVVTADFTAAAERVVRSIADRSDPVAAVADVLVEVLRTSPNDSRLIAEVRGIQAAAWNHDLLVSVDLPCLLNSQERPRVPFDEAGSELLAYRQPYRAITWLLAAHHVGLDEIPTLVIQASSPDGASIATANGSIDVNPALRPVVRAQRLLRLNTGADADAPLLPYAPKTLSNALTAAANDLGLPAHGRLAERRTLAPLAWLKKLGITIRPLP